MSTGPVEGDGIAISLAGGKVVFWSAMVQAAWDQFVQLKDPSGDVVFTATGASPDGHSPTQIGEGFFQVPSAGGDYTVWIGIDGGEQWSQVVWGQDALTGNGQTYMTRFVFASEDGADQDYNDSFVQMQWFEHLG